MKDLIDGHVLYCVFQRRFDSVLAIMSFLSVAALVFKCYAGEKVMQYFFLCLSAVIHGIILAYCRRLWNVRIRRWESLNRKQTLLENSEELSSLSGELKSSLLQSASTAVEIHTPRPISS